MRQAKKIMTLPTALFTTLSCISIFASLTVHAQIPYVTRNGIEEVDYRKLNILNNFKLPDSGQFRETTWVTGEDNDYTRHPMSFSISDDGKLTIDNNTGLMWERHINWRYGKVVPAKGEFRPQDVFTYGDGEPRRRPYHEGVQYCKQLRLGGYDDWRIPNMKEAHTITHYAAARPTIDMHYFKDVFPGLPGYGDRGKGGMWGGPIAPDHPNSAWHLGFIDGHFMGYPRGGYKTTRCVRADNNGSYYLPELKVNGDGTVTDKITGITWIQRASEQLFDWEEAIQYCEDLSFADHSDWKLPHTKEMSSIVDLEKQKPALDDGIFTNIDYKAYYWSRTPETRDAARNLMSETTVQPGDLNINNAKENAWLTSYMLGASWRAPRRLKGHALCSRY
ncbi:MAG: DUF1566 domain-containing protein [Motiliproteus sp.]